MVINIHLEFVVNVGMHLAVALLALGIFSVGEITLQLIRRRMKREGKK